MHHNYHFLKHLAKELNHSLKGLELATCFSQNADELMLGFCNPDREFWVKALVHPTFSCLSFPNEFHRAKKNSVDLFPSLIGQLVEEVWVFENERAMGIRFQDGQILIAKLFGNRSNVIRCEEGEPVELFRRKEAGDRERACGDYHRKIDQSFEAFREKGLRKIFPTLGKELLSKLEGRGWSDASSGQQWEMLQALLEELKEEKFYIGLWKGKPKLWMLNPPEDAVDVEEAGSAIEACNAFFYRYSKTFYLEKERAEALKALQQRIKSSWSYIEKSAAKLDELLHGSRYEETGHIIMANLHQIPTRAKKVSLHDFYRDQPIDIKLNPDLTPQKNAENYYRKSKNQKIEVAKLRENIERKELQLEKLERQLQELEQFEHLRDLRKFLKQEGLVLDQQDSQQLFPFRKFVYEGFEIWVGKNAKNNDLLTQQYAYKEDLWLHARDVAGSHVIVKYKAGKAFPETVIEKAASLAAYYSTRKNDSLCPVICTPKKYVRKPKGLAPGMVVVDKEEVVMIEPAPFEA